MYENTLSLNTMKNMNIDDIIRLYQQGYILEDTKRDVSIINLQTCTTTISADRTSAIAGDFIRLTATVDPPAPGTTITFKAETRRSSRTINYDIGTCDASTGTCFVDWDTAYRDSGVPIHVTAVASGPYDCTSTPVDITLGTPPIKLGDVVFIAIVAIPSVIAAIYLLSRK